MFLFSEDLLDGRQSLFVIWGIQIIQYHTYFLDDINLIFQIYHENALGEVMTDL